MSETLTVLEAIEVAVRANKQYTDDISLAYNKSQNLDVNERSTAKNNMGVYVQAYKPIGGIDGDIWIDNGEKDNIKMKIKMNGEWVVQSSGSVSGAVLYDSMQTLTDSEKDQARLNINAPSFNDIPTSISDLENDSNFLDKTDKTLEHEGVAADAKAVGDAIEAIKDSFGNIGEDEKYGAININVHRIDNIITVTTILEDGSSSTSIIELNEDELPTMITTDDAPCTITWEGEF